MLNNQNYYFNKKVSIIIISFWIFMIIITLKHTLYLRKTSNIKCNHPFIEATEQCLIKYDNEDDKIECIDEYILKQLNKGIDFSDIYDWEDNNFEKGWMKRVIDLSNNENNYIICKSCNDGSKKMF